MYIDAWHDSKENKIKVVERVDDKRVHREFPARYLFYYEDPVGEHESIFGDRLSKFETGNYKKFHAERNRRKERNETLFESDCDIVFRCLEDNYMNAETPKPNIAFFDIEVDFHQEKGFAPPHDPFNRLTCIGLHLEWLDQSVCLALKPDSMDRETAEKIIDGIPEAMLMDSEEDLLNAFFELIEDADILSGWNSKSYDIPYLVNRTQRILGDHATRKFCLWNQKPRKKSSLDKYKNEIETFSIVGRVHFDYMVLYSKYTYEEKHSMALDFISDLELGERKVEYNGTLDQLYNQDFEKFIRYNIQDVELLKKLDAKLQFIGLANSIAHSNTVRLDTVLGTVAQIDQAVINEAHSRGLIVHDKISHDQDDGAAGAFVFPPKKGLHKWLGSMDLASLYPSILRSFNMSPDTIVGQLRDDHTDKDREKWEKAIAERERRGGGKKKNDERYWNGKFSTKEYDLVMDKDMITMITVDFENGETLEMTGDQVHDLVFQENWCLTRNGTIFTFEKDGVIPALLGRWYSERKEMQAEARKARDDEDRFKYLDRRQLVRKILLNSAYGSLLNRHSRFFDPRLGQSVTLNGRGIARHMAAKVNEIVCGEYDNMGDSVLYGDTDSTYFTVAPMIGDEMDSESMSKEELIELYDAICDQVNESFPEYMKEHHNCPEEFGKIINAARELVCESGLFILKKRYGLLIFDDDGKRMDVDGKRGKVKVTGLDSQRSDTPKFMQDFLDKVLEKVLYGKGEDYIMKMIREFRKEFRAKDPWEKGTPKRVNNLASKYKEWKSTGKCGVGHVMASINYNNMLDSLDDKHSSRITDGMKTIVSKLKNMEKSMKTMDSSFVPVEVTRDGHKRIPDWYKGMTSIAIPIDENVIPEWFKALPFEENLMEEKIVDDKLENLLEVLGWDLRASDENGAVFDELFG